MPGDNVVASGTLAVVASGSRFVLSAGEWPILVSGDAIRTSGFAEPGNNGRFTVAAVEASAVIVTSATLADEAEGPVVRVRVQTLPASLQGLCHEIVRDRWFGRRRDGEIVSEKIGDWAATYRGAAGSTASEAAEDGGFTPNVTKRLGKWVRIA